MDHLLRKPEQEECKITRRIRAPLWSSFVKDYEYYLFGGSEFQLQRRYGLLLAHNHTGLRIFNTQHQETLPMLSVNGSISCAQMNDRGTFLIYVSVDHDEWKIVVVELSTNKNYYVTRNQFPKDMPADATVNLTWVTESCFLASVSGHEYGSKWVFRIVETVVECVVMLPNVQVRDTEEPCEFLMYPIALDRFRRENNYYFGVEYVLAIEVSVGVYQAYSILENFRPLPLLQPFARRRRLQATWATRDCVDSTISSCYVAFYVVDDSECRREVAVYLFHSQPLVWEEVLRVPMYPGELACHLSCSFTQVGVNSHLKLSCTAPGREEIRLYKLGTGVSVAQRFRGVIQFPGRIACYGKEGTRPPAGGVDEELIDALYQQLPCKYQIVQLVNDTLLSIRELCGDCKEREFFPFDVGKKFTFHYSDVAANESINHENSSVPCLVLLLPEPNEIGIFESLKLYNIRDDKTIQHHLQFHEARLSRLHQFVITRFNLTFTVIHGNQVKCLEHWDPEGDPLDEKFVKWCISPDERFVAVAACGEVRVFTLFNEGSIGMKQKKIDHYIHENKNLHDKIMTRFGKDDEEEDEEDDEKLNKNIMNKKDNTTCAIAQFEYEATATCRVLEFKSCKSGSFAHEWDHLFYCADSSVWVHFDGSQFTQCKKLVEVQRPDEVLENGLVLMRSVNAKENDTISMVRVDADMAHVLDICMPKCRVVKLPHNNQLLAYNSTSLRVFDFGIVDSLEESLTITDYIVEKVYESLDKSYVAIKTMGFSDGVVVVRLLGSGPQILRVRQRETTADFIPLGYKCTVIFAASSPPSHMVVHSPERVSVYKLLADSVEWLTEYRFCCEVEMLGTEFICLKHINGVVLIDTKDSSLHVIASSQPDVRLLGNEYACVLFDDGGSFQVYHLQQPTPILICGQTHLVKQNGAFSGSNGLSKLEVQGSCDGTYVVISNRVAKLSTDVCFIHVFETKTGNCILKREYEHSPTNIYFHVFFLSSSFSHLMICSPSGTEIEIFDLTTSPLKHILHKGGESAPPGEYSANRLISTVPLITATTTTTTTATTTPTTTKESVNLKHPPLFWIFQRSLARFEFYYFTATNELKSFTTNNPYGSLQPAVSVWWPYLYLSPSNGASCWVQKVDSSEHIFQIVTNEAIQESRFMGTDNEFLYLRTATESLLYNVAEKIEVFRFPGVVIFQLAPSSCRGIAFLPGSSQLYLVELGAPVALSSFNPRQNSQDNRTRERIESVEFSGNYLVVISTMSIAIFKDGPHTLTLCGEILVDASWAPGSWQFHLVMGGKLGALCRTDYFPCLALYRNTSLLDSESGDYMKWPLIDVPIDCKADEKWTNARFHFIEGSDPVQYIYCYVPQKSGAVVLDLSRLCVDRFPILTWSSVEHVLQYDLARSLEHPQNIDMLLNRYSKLLSGALGPKKGALRALDHLVDSRQNLPHKGRYLALRLLLDRVPSFELVSQSIPDVDPSAYRQQQTLLGALVAAKDWPSVSVLLDFLVKSSKNGKLVPLTDSCSEFVFELCDVAKHDAPLIAKFLRDFGLQKLPQSSPVVADLLGVGKVDFMGRPYLTCGSDVREPKQLWSLTKLKRGKERYEVCYVTIPGLSSGGKAFQQLVEVAQEVGCPDLIANPAIETVVNFKWQRYAFHRYVYSFCIHIGATVCMSIVCCLLHMQDSRRSLREIRTPEGIACLTLLCILATYALRCIWKEIQELQKQEVRSYVRVGLGNGLVNLQTALILTTFFLYIARSWWTHIVAGITVVVCYIFILFHLQPLDSTGSKVRMILRITREMKVFTGVLVLCVLACEFYFISVSQNTGIGGGDVAQVFLNMFETFLFFTFDQDYFDVLPPVEKVFAYLMLVGGSMLVAVVLLNLLIAMMGDSYQAINAKDKQQFQLLKASMVREIEMTMTKKAKDFPLWVHCLAPLKDAEEATDDMRKMLKEEFRSFEEKLFDQFGPNAPDWAQKKMLNHLEPLDKNKPSSGSNRKARQQTLAPSFAPVERTPAPLKGFSRSASPASSPSHPSPSSYSLPTVSHLSAFVSSASSSASSSTLSPAPPSCPSPVALLHILASSSSPTALSFPSSSLPSDSSPI